ncbi:translation initiation factor IF-6 [Halobaculum sp. MBLA0147]|uniref:translation initiation factor IF-6 n=1 Tax=Halobaculum sp. MBLA0147 TaxID=3079934 RepID=UPI003524C691
MLRTSFTGSSYVGVYARATDDVLLIDPAVDDDVTTAIAEELSVTAVETTVGGSGTVGSLTVANETGVVVSDQATDEEIDLIADATDGAVARIPGRLNAAGNVVLANDTGAVVHPELTDEAVSVVEDTLDVPVTDGRLADVQTVGTAAVATEDGVICHPQATEEQLTAIEEHLDVYADLGTVNYGAPLVGSGVIANEADYVAGEDTTGPELGRIEDTLGYI